MDISVKKLSEILKIDPNALLQKMIAAGLPQKDIEDLVSTEDKQTLLSYIRSSKDSPVQEKKLEVPKELTPKKESKNKIEDKPRNEVKKEQKIKTVKEKSLQTQNKEKSKKSVNINGSIRVQDLLFIMLLLNRMLLKLEKHLFYLSGVGLTIQIKNV